jgi:cytochrome oxidase Cu insertion factor (SCO1/SenC/PrrC family)
MALVLGLAAAAAGSAWAHSEHTAPAAKQNEPVAEIPVKQTAKNDARAYFTDTQLVTQDGKKVRFYSDVLAGRTVLINVIYTNCKDACPLVTQKLLEVKARIGDLYGKEVHFVSISSDPERDSPAELKAFAKKQNADIPGWTFLTGDKQNIDFILKRLGQFSQHVEDHSTLLIAGNVPAKHWKKIPPSAPAPMVATQLQLLVNPDAMLGPIGAPPKAN